MEGPAMHYSLSIESLRKNFPAGFQVPVLLLDFGSWLKSKRTGGVRYFSLQSDRFNDYWIENQRVMTNGQLFQPETTNSI